MPKDEANADPQATKDSGADTQQPDAAAADSQQDNAAEQGTRTFTQPELDAIVNARVAKATKAAEKAALEAARREREREGMDEVERMKAEKAEAEAERQRLLAENRRLLLRSQLAGKVVDLDDAVAILSDDYVDEAGQVDVDASLQAKPHIRATQADRADRANPGNPPGSKRLTRDQIAQMSEKEIEERWAEVEPVLQASPT